MDLEVIVPTYNRCASLERTLLSILKVPIPDCHSLSVIVADNKSTDNTKQVVEAHIPSFHGRLRYVAATKGQGSSFARNAGILATKSELLAFIDDDEELDAKWAETAFRSLSDPAIDYLGGRCEPVWEATPPPWVDHPNTRTGLGWADFGSLPRGFQEADFPGVLLSGNSVIRRRCFDRIGLYSESLGRSGNRLMGAEDTEVHERLRMAGFHGLYLPDLVVQHYIPASRLTKRYMRRWAFWTSVSTVRMILPRPEAGPKWFGLPRYMYGRLLRSPFQLIRSALAGQPAETFHHELNIWRFMGTFYGKHFYRGE